MFGSASQAAVGRDVLDHQRRGCVRRLVDRSGKDDGVNLAAVEEHIQREGEETCMVECLRVSDQKESDEWTARQLNKASSRKETPQGWKMRLALPRIPERSATT
mmetsp:Transcript_91044/g.256594  ORF Transcript_91044/g.256594 Transcript_91044/m.256594 type:complete len:104 (-) Transcript_91044:261-572(-)